MLSSKRYIVFSLFSISSVVISCSDGQSNGLEGHSRAKQVSSQSTEEADVQVASDEIHKADKGALSSSVTSSEPDFDLAARGSEGLLNLETINAARLAGMSDDLIISEATRHSLSFEVESLSALGLSKFVLSGYGVQTVGGIKAMGLAAVNRARAEGLTDNEIRVYAHLQGISFGEEALKSLGLSKFVLSGYGVQTVGGIKAMGLAAVNRARAAGLSDDEVRKFATLQNVSFGEEALNSLGMSKFVLSSYGGEVVDGIRAMGLTAVDRARAAGLSDSQIKIYAKLQNIFFGERALVSLG